MACSWDERKRSANLAKHGVDFAMARRIFDGPTLEWQDLREGRNYGQARMCAYGEVDGEVLFVVYTWRRGVRRLISARRVGRHEPARYRAAIPRARPDGAGRLGALA